MSAPQAMAAGTPRPRPFLWSVRRELWEHRAIYVAPLAVSGVVLAAFLVASWHVPHSVRAAVSSGNDANINMPYAAAAAANFMIGAVVAVFYCLAALSADRRDRSVLFWKSLPVSDTVTVLAKAATPMVVLPLVILAASIGAQLAMLALSTLVLLLSGMDPGLLWSRLDLPMYWLMLP
jgi:ABC-2 type transport system permease protein